MKTRPFHLWRLCVLLAVLGLMPAGRAPAQSFKILHQFAGGANDGAEPLWMHLIQGTDGNFYGTTEYGGASNCGTIFRINSAGSESVLYEFKGYQANDGAFPEAGLVQASDGNFYGTTYEGGTNVYGTVFRVTPAGVLTNLHIFQGPATHDGRWPFAPLIQGTNGLLYGTTSAGGTRGYGSVFQMDLSGNLEVIYSFSNGADGSDPYAGVFQGSDGNFYGTTEMGGTNGNYGTLYRVTAAGVLTPLHEFGATATDGENPLAGVVQGYTGNFYGTTYDGGSNGSGTVFMYTPAGVFTNLYHFGGTAVDGLNPRSPLLQGSDSYLYGTTFEGGTNGVGALFKIGPAGGLIYIHAFDAFIGDGIYPEDGVVEGYDGNYYGTTYMGGTNGLGVVYQLVVPPNQNPNQIPNKLSITDIGSTASTTYANISFRSIAGENIQLQFSDSLLPVMWSNTPAWSITNCIGGPLTITDIETSTTVPERFYRLQITP